MTTTDVVPSPASTSCAALRSTNIFAAGCITAISFNIVFPSFVCDMNELQVRIDRISSPHTLLSFRPFPFVSVNSQSSDTAN